MELYTVSAKKLSKSVSYWAESQIEKKIALEVIKILEVKRVKFKEG